MPKTRLLCRASLNHAWVDSNAWPFSRRYRQLYLGYGTQWGVAMNGIHDMGGMMCFGPVVREENEPVFHADWERRTFAMNIAAAGVFGPVDRLRHANERMDPGHYINSDYYEHWLAGLEILAKEAGFTEEEIATGVSNPPTPTTEPPPDGEVIAALMNNGFPANRDSGRLEPNYSVGDRVRARNIHPPGHTRLPRYVRGREGVVDRIHGTHVFPDTAAHHEGENPQPLYSVRFAARELWGPKASGNDVLRIDLWEDYLEPLD